MQKYFNHQYRTYGTIFIETPEIEEFKSIIKQSLENIETKIPIKLGFSVISHKDKYDKKIGREVSEKRAKTVFFKLLVLSFVPIKINGEIVTQVRAMLAPENLDFDCITFTYLPKSKRLRVECDPHVFLYMDKNAITKSIKE